MHRQILYLDQIIGQTMEMVNGIRASDMDSQAKDTFYTAVYDVLQAAGVPTGGIMLVLGADILPIDAGPFFGAQCSLCDEAAHTVVKTRAGYRLACAQHELQAEAEGLQIHHPAVWFVAVGE